MKIKNLIGVLKAMIAVFLGQVIAVYHRFFPSTLKEIRLPWGATWLPTHDYTSFCLCYGIGYEKYEQAFLSDFLQKGWVFLDIGAHHGFYTLLASHKVGPEGAVISFEPSCRERERLKKHLGVNGCANVSVEPFALSDAEGTGKLFVCTGIETGCNSLQAPLVFGQTTAMTVPITTLDRYLKDHPVSRIDFIKIDVEGAELSVLKGASGLLSSTLRPLIMCELVDVRTEKWGYDSRAVLKLLEGFGYCFFRFLPDKFLKEMPSEEKYNENILAVPREKLPLIEPFLP